MRARLANTSLTREEVVPFLEPRYVISSDRMAPYVSGCLSIVSVKLVVSPEDQDSRPSSP